MSSLCLIADLYCNTQIDESKQDTPSPCAGDALWQDRFLMFMLKLCFSILSDFVTAYLSYTHRLSASDGRLDT